MYFENGNFKIYFIFLSAIINESIFSSFNCSEIELKWVISSIKPIKFHFSS